ncbi:MAG: WSD1 family O-acyltransferase, partial [Sandaracinaceae bacterium]|nr:WSD1 family O-acyltransferase [Sandaracinaceae bacterium]
PDKRAAWSAPVALDDVKRIGRALGGTVNDVLLSAVSGALRGTLLDAGEEPFDVRVAVPVSLREPSEMEELGNRFGLVFLDLPVTIAGPQGRFRELKRRMDALKGSPEAILLFRLMQIAGGGPRWVEELLVWILGAKTTAVMTNVPGPREPRYLAGGRIRTIMFWVPQAGRVGVGVSIFSYAGEVRLGLNADARALPDPERVLERFALEIEALRVT